MQDSGISGILLIRMSFKVFHTASLVIVAFFLGSYGNEKNIDSHLGVDNSCEL